MAANKFATMLHRNTNKITLILIYAVLEWTLIILLLLNSLFSYFIIKFAEYFGLKPPCLWCSRVDHLFDHTKNNNIHRDLLCEAHATEVSKLSFCTNHHRLVEGQDMCQDCSSSRPGVSDKFGLFPWMKEIKMIENGKEMTLENDGEVALKCSCCGVCLETKFSTPYILIKPSWDDLEYTHKGNLIIEASDLDQDEDDCVEKGDALDQNRTDYTAEDQDEDGRNVVHQFLSDNSVPNSDVKEVEGEKEHVVLDGVTEYIEEKYKEKMLKDQGVQASEIEDAALEIPPQHLEFFIDCSGHRLVPIELIDSTNEEDESKSQEKDENQEKDGDFQDDKEEVKLVLENRTIQVEEEVAGVCLRNDEREPKFAVLESMDKEEDENDLVFYPKELHSEREAYEQFEHVQESSKYHQVQILAAKERGEEDEEEEEKEENLDVPPVLEELSKLLNNETDGEVSIGTEIPDLDLADEEPSTNSAPFHQVEVHGPNEDEELTVELKTLSVDLSGHVLNNQSSICSDLNEFEEDKFPDTPTSTDSFHQFHQKLLLVEKKDSGTEDSLDGSVVSELESGDTVSTIEHLKSALKAERKALHSLYTELEEERSASAVAASQTMAMINRLQEEKAAMQMEALQYQRMMEEQSEYDQEALQLMNELMVKREKEKQEVEKELEVYRKRLLEYETKERMRMLKRSKDSSTRSGFSSASCSNAEDSDELSIDLNQDAKEDDSFYCHQEGLNHGTPVDAVINLEESLADFEEERMAILDQLKVLEEKLISLDDEDTKHFEDVRQMEDSYQDNGNHIEEDSHLNGEMNGHANGFLKEINGKHHPDRRIMNVKGKRLLPLFDAMSDENGGVALNGHENGYHSNGVHDSYLKKFDLESKKLEVEEEFDHLHERLQALEADKEFLKNCVSSLKKGDKGMDLLQEILLHLRDLRNVELRSRSMSDGPTV